MTGENHQLDRAKKQRLVRHAFERSAALCEGAPFAHELTDPQYRLSWSHRLEQLAEQGVHRLICEQQS